MKASVFSQYPKLCVEKLSFKEMQALLNLLRQSLFAVRQEQFFHVDLVLDFQVQISKITNEMITAGMIVDRSSSCIICHMLVSF